MVLWPGCGGRDEFSLHTKNVRSVWFLVKRRGCCCNLSGGVVLIMWFTTNRMCVKNNTIVYVARASNSKRDCEHDLYCCLLPWCEALCTYRSGFPIATLLCWRPKRMNYVVRMLAMTDCGYIYVRGLTVVVACNIEAKTNHWNFLQCSLSARTISHYRTENKYGVQMHHRTVTK